MGDYNLAGHDWIDFPLFNTINLRSYENLQGAVILSHGPPEFRFCRLIAALGLSRRH